VITAGSHSLAGWIQPLRLGTGLVMVTYLTTHFLNHALGLVSLAAMETGRGWFLFLWRNSLLTVLLYGSLITHIFLAFWSLYQRRHLRIPVWEALQLLLGLCIPPLLAGHIVGTRLAHEWFGFDDSYTMVLLTIWVSQPERGVRQAILLLLAWAHACIGLHYWLRLKSWYPRAASLLLAGAIVLPLLALLGFVQGGREVSALARQPGWVGTVRQKHRPPDAAGRRTLGEVGNGITVAFGAAVAGTLAARAARQWISRRRGKIRITYPQAREVVVPVFSTVLEASRLAGIPHASVCGGAGPLLDVPGPGDPRSRGSSSAGPTGTACPGAGWPAPECAACLSVAPNPRRDGHSAPSTKCRPQRRHSDARRICRERTRCGCAVCGFA